MRGTKLYQDKHNYVDLHVFLQGAIMAVGASEPTVVATKDGRIGMKSQMQVIFLRSLSPN